MLLVMVMLLVLPEPVLLLLVSAPVLLDMAWVAVGGDNDNVPGLGGSQVSGGDDGPHAADGGDLRGVGHVHVTSVLPYLTLGAGLGSGVRRGGGNEVGDALSDCVVAAEADLVGDILCLAISGRMVWGSGIVGRMWRIGAERV
jgi:hypothetical protein